jgi:hypothetical protein
MPTPNRNGSLSRKYNKVYISDDFQLLQAIRLIDNHINAIDSIQKWINNRSITTVLRVDNLIIVQESPIQGDGSGHD